MPVHPRNLQPIMLARVVAKLESIAPLALAESWDNVGLLAGDLGSSVQRIMTCLTISRETVREAIDGQAELIVTHHPLPFKPLQKIVTSSAAGQSLWSLLREGIAIYSPHTAWDNAYGGINARLAELLSLADVRPIRKIANAEAVDPSLGAGRVGSLAPSRSIAEIVSRLRTMMPSIRATSNQSAEHRVDRVAIVCGSGGSFVDAARLVDANLLLTGEATYHQCLEAQASGLAMLMIGHFDSERFAMDLLAEALAVEFPSLDVWASRNERDSVIEID